MKKRLLPILTAIPLIAVSPIVTLSSCACNSGPEPTLVYKVALECAEGGTINKKYVEVAAGAQWKTVSSTIKTTPDDGKKFYCWKNEDNKIVDGEYVINKAQTIRATWINADFKEDSWKHLISLSTGGLDNIKKYYNLKTTDSLVGQEREITLSGLTYKVRVIGENHDDIVNASGELTGEKAPLTFQLTSLVSDKAKKSVSKTLYHNTEEGITPNYKETILKRNIDGDGAQGEPGGLIWTKSCIDLLKESNPELFNGLKKVRKQYWYPTSYENSTYDTNLFALTFKEMGFPYDQFHSPSEGETYKYWSNKTANDRIMKDSNNQPFEYALVSRRQVGGDPGTERHIYYVDTTGNVQHRDFYSGIGNDYFGVTFAFCI